MLLPDQMEKKSHINVWKHAVLFPTKRSDMGAGFLNIYELTWEGQKKPVTLYLNIYEKGILMVPMGLSLKKSKLH